MKALFLFVMLQVSFSGFTQIVYPASKEVNSHILYHGTKVNDSFQWMEDLNSPEIKTWSAAQDTLLKSYLPTSSTKSKIQSRIKELVNFDLYSTPTLRNGIYYYSKNSKDNDLPKIYFQKRFSSKENLLIDPTLHKEEGFRLVMNGSSSGFTMSEKGGWMTYHLSKKNQRWYEVQMLEVDTKEKRERLLGFHSLGGGPVWYKEEGFFYNRFRVPNDTEKLTSQVGYPDIFFHRVGTSQTEDILVLEKNFLGEGWYYTISVSDDNKFLIIDARKGSSTTNRIFVKRIGTKNQFKEIFQNLDASYNYLGNDKNDYFFYTDYTAPNGKIIRTSIRNWKKTIVDIIPETDEVISANSLVGGNALGYFNEKLVVKYTKRGQPFIKIFSKKGKHLFNPTLPLGGSIWGGFKGEAQDDEIFYQFLGLIDPSSIYRLDLKTGRIEIFKRSVGLQQKDFIVEKVTVANNGGVEIPMFVARKKTTELNGQNPGFIYGYGAFGWVSFIWYQPQILLWLEQGGVYAIPGIRGGGENGSEWHTEGTKINKQNGIDDYITASEWLINSKYVSKNKLVANGGSISAVVAGAALNQRPELYGAAIIDRPALDLLRFPKFTGAKAWLEELGSPNNDTEFEALYQYSPYHNLEAKCYPPTLVMIGDEDETTPPLHAYKYVARLQKKNTCKYHPILLKTMKGVGHNFGNTDDQKIDSFTSMMYFLFKSLDIKIHEN
ncbi:MAG: prolyl oligopeptidase family serine peptidase [Bacteroidota bacterium]